MTTTSITKLGKNSKFKLLIFSIQIIMIFILMTYITIITVNFGSFKSDMEELGEFGKNVVTEVDKSFKGVATPYIASVFIIDGNKDC